MPTLAIPVRARFIIDLPSRISANERYIRLSAERDSGGQSLLPFGHTPTEISSQDSLGEKSQTDLECSRSVVLMSKFRCLCRWLRVPIIAAMASSRVTFQSRTT